MMKKTGYRGEFAGAVEAAASTGGQIMPPIMGAAAFLMAEYTGIPYARIALLAILPAVLYFTGIFMAVHLEAKTAYLCRVLEMGGAEMYVTGSNPLSTQDDVAAAQAQEASLQAAFARLQKSQLELTTELAQVGSSSYIESRARTDYAFLKPGEIRFEVVNPDALEGYTEEEMKILMQELVY